MTTKRLRAHRGAVLPFTLVLTAAAAIAVGATVSYVSNASRSTQVFLAKDRCRLAAQSAVEQAKNEIQSGFNAFVGVGTTVKVDPKQAESYDWFDKVSADRKTIGEGTKRSVTLVSPVTINGCTCYVGIGQHVDHAERSSVAEVPVIATAVWTGPGGLKVTSTIQERVMFATGQSEVFNYAYFVNNYGWMNGSSITINGDMRANGNISLNGSTVNGFIYGAVNSEVGADGRVSLSSARIKSQRDYRSAAGTRARPDTADYDTDGAYDAPAASGSIAAPVYDRSGNMTSGTKGSTSGKPIVNAKADPVPMPFVSELQSYIDYAQEYNENRGGRLTCPAYSYKDSANQNHTVAAKSVTAHYDGPGPSEDASLADNGALVLVGTASSPIVIDGPVVVDNDVIIKGYVKGQGTIYSGRNVHIIGDLRYVNSPTWGHPDGDDAAVETANESKDMLGLVAKGNIVIGDSSSSSWMSSVGNYIKSGTSSSVVKSYACDESDADIGYPTTFRGDYTAKEYVAGKGVDGSGYFGKVSTEIRQVTTTRQVEVDDTSKPVYRTETVRVWGGTRTRQVLDHYEKKIVTQQVTENVAVPVTKTGRCYYQTACDDKVMQSLKDSSGVAQIDAVLYNNHGIFGTPGRSGYTFNLNGSLICRDEALIFSGDGINFNWDMRLMPKRSNKVTSKVSLPVGMQEPYTAAWQEVPDEQNRVYQAAMGIVN